jgi:hypothetical protein
MARVNKQVTIVGSSFHHGAGNWIMKMSPGQQLRLVRDPSNKHDKNAIAVYIFQQCLGYVARGLAAELAPRMDAGLQITAIKSRIEGAVMVMSWDEPDADDPCA